MPSINNQKLTEQNKKDFEEFKKHFNTFCHDLQKNIDELFNNNEISPVKIFKKAHNQILPNQNTYSRINLNIKTKNYEDSLKIMKNLDLFLGQGSVLKKIIPLENAGELLKGFYSMDYQHPITIYMSNKNTNAHLVETNKKDKSLKSHHCSYNHSIEISFGEKMIYKNAKIYTIFTKTEENQFLNALINKLEAKLLDENMKEIKDTLENSTQKKTTLKIL